METVFVVGGKQASLGMPRGLQNLQGLRCFEICCVLLKTPFKHTNQTVIVHRTRGPGSTVYPVGSCSLIKGQMLLF